MADELDSEQTEDFDSISHSEARSLFRMNLAEITGDPLLVGLPSEPTLEEVNSQIALEHGRAIIVNVLQQDEDRTVLPVVVVSNATVHDLKKAIERHISLKVQREGATSYLSWGYVWKTYWLTFNGQKLTEDLRSLKDYGIGSKDEVTFIKRLRRK